MYKAYKYLNTLKQFRRVLCQDLAYLKITNEDHWLLHETPFNTPEFETYTEKAKVAIQKSNNDKLKRNKVINSQAINDIIEYQNNSMTKNIQKIMKESIDEVNNNLMNESKIIKEEISKNNEGVSTAIDYINYLSAYNAKNNECDASIMSLPIFQSNESTLEEQLERTTLGNVSWYTKNNIVTNENVPKIPKSFETLQ